MTADDINTLLEDGFKSCVAAFFAMGLWVWRGLISLVQKTRDDMTKQLQDFNDHKLHVSESYAKKTELEPIYRKLDEVGSDVKILIGRKQEKEN